MKKHFWSDEELEWFVALYPDENTMDLVEIFNRPIRQIYQAAARYGLSKSEAYKNGPFGGGFQKGSDVGARFRFPKGHKPMNKGKKMAEYVTNPETLKRIRSSQFKKGSVPGNTLHDGAIVIRHSHKERKNPPYKWIRISKGKWEMLHVNVWKKTNGEIPTGHIIVFKDKNTLNVEIENLEMITLAENMRRNTIHNLPAELKPIIHLKSKLTRTINNKIKNEQGN